VLWVVACSLALVFSHLVFLRYLLPQLPAVLALLAVRTARLAARSTRLGWVALAVLSLALVPSIARVIAFDRFVGRTDTRTLARRWMERRLPTGTTIHAPAYQPTFPFFVPAALRDEFTCVPADRADLDGLSRGDLVLVATQPFRGSPLAARLGQAADVLFDFDPVRAGATSPAYEPADAFFVPLAGFASVARPGPHLTLYRMRGALPPDGAPAAPPPGAANTAGR
jgi:hypothetical protein